MERNTKLSEWIEIETDLGEIGGDHEHKLLAHGEGQLLRVLALQTGLRVGGRERVSRSPTVINLENGAV
jgi:hypothetical protein